MKPVFRYTLIILISAFLFLLYALWADKALTSRDFEITSSKISDSFDGFKITHISDLHNTLFGKDNERLIKKITDEAPDIIVVTGDIIDSRRTDVSIAVDFLERAVKIAPVYYVTGNHEYRVGCEELYTAAKNLGVIMPEGKALTVKHGDGEITLCGIADPTFGTDGLVSEEGAIVSRALEKLSANDGFTILLSHRPEFFDLYAEYGFNLVFSGHAHGGQFRFPLVGRFIAPGQGLFPEYDSGLYRSGDTSMIVSRGLGNSIIPLRLFNRPEIITVTLNSD